jgi:hypothetical protein
MINPRSSNARARLTGSPSPPASSCGPAAHAPGIGGAGHPAPVEASVSSADHPARRVPAACSP